MFFTVSISVQIQHRSLNLDGGERALFFGDGAAQPTADRWMTVFARMQSESAAERIHGAWQALAHALRVGSTSTSRPGPAATGLNRRFKLTFVGRRARVTVA
jgi:hypothetical protein